MVEKLTQQPKKTQETKRFAPKITRLDLKLMNTPLAAYGILYMASLKVDPHTMTRVGRAVQGQEWFQRLLEENKDFVSGPENESSEFRNMMLEAWRNMPEEEREKRKDDPSHYRELAEKLFDFYLRYKSQNNGEQPPWFFKLDSETQRLLSNKEVWDSLRRFPPRYRFSPLEYAGIDLYAMDNIELFEDISEVFHLWRLTDIKQLAQIRDPLPAETSLKETSFEFSHTRYAHSFDVLAIANLLGHNAGLSEREIFLLQLAAVSHDYLTPAGGDMTKLIDPEAFDEDEHYNEIFGTKEWKAFVKKYNISKQEEEKLYGTIKGEGTTGKLLDFADKMAYMARDLDHFLNQVIRTVEYVDEQGVRRFPEEESAGFREIKRILQADSEICALWDGFEIADDKIVIHDHAKLANFLKIRALNVKELWYNPYSRFFPYKFIQEIVRDKYKKGILKKEQLTSMGDSQLFWEIRDVLDSGATNLAFLRSPKNKIKKFDTLEKAREFARKASQDPETIAIVDDWRSTTNSGAGKFFVRKEGAVVPFSEAYPEQSRELDSILATTNEIHVYVLNLEDIGVPEDRRAEVRDIFSAAI